MRKYQAPAGRSGAIDDARAAGAGHRGLSRTLDLFGEIVRVEAPAGAAASTLETLLANFPTSRRRPTSSVTVTTAGTVLTDGAPVPGGCDAAFAVPRTLWSLTRIACRTRTRVVLHAAAVSHHGRALLMPGPSGAGKSTLSAALVLDGWQLLSDELGGIDLTGTLVYSFLRPIALGPDSPLRGRLGDRGYEDPAGDRHVPVDELRAGSASPACPLGAVVFARYQPGTASALRAIGPGQALLRLAGQAVNVPALEGTGFAALGTVARRCPAYAFDFDDLAEAAAVLGKLILDPPLQGWPERDENIGSILALELDDETVAFDSRAGAVHHLNAEATLVRNLARASDGLDDVVTGVARATGRDEREVSADVHEIAARLNLLGLIKPAGPGEQNPGTDPAPHSSA